MGGYVVSRPYSEPPSNWAGAAAASGDVYYLLDDDGCWFNLPAGTPPIGRLVIWHWCPAFALDDEPGGRWAPARADKHDLMALDPLHLEPSILWDCCGKHGWIRQGAWTDA